MALAKGKHVKKVVVTQPVQPQMMEVEVEDNPKKYLEFSKKLVVDIRSLLWIVTVGGMLLAFYCVYKEFDGSLPWVAAMVGLPWTAHGVVCSFYLKMSQSDHRRGGITFEAAKAENFGVELPTYDTMDFGDLEGEPEPVRQPIKNTRKGVDTGNPVDSPGI